MKLTFLDKHFKTLAIGASTVMIAFLGFTVQAQQQEEHSNPHVRSGQKALLDGDFKSAAAHLEKALPAESSDPNVLYLLGYSQFQSGDYAKAAVSFEQVIKLDSQNATAYYYKGKANNNLAVNTTTKLKDEERANLLKSAIADYTKAIEVNAEDAKLYQNRAIAYRDLGILTGTDGTPNYDKTAAVDAYNKAVVDYEKVLTYDATRKDIQTEIKKAKVYRDNLK